VRCRTWRAGPRSAQHVAQRCTCPTHHRRLWGGGLVRLGRP
jgi:hypothetical protein